MPNKTETFRVERVNAEFRHYLACLACCTRCFPRSFQRLSLVLRLFIFAWNRRQAYHLRFPNTLPTSKILSTLDFHHSPHQLYIAGYLDNCL
jgi:hypothetical protein